MEKLFSFLIRPLATALDHLPYSQGLVLKNFGYLLKPNLPLRVTLGVFKKMSHRLGSQLLKKKSSKNVF